MRYAIVAALVVLCGVVAVAENATEKGAQRLVFKNAGFSIAPLDEPGKEAGLILTMSLPAKGEISPGVVVVTQKYAGTMDEYVASIKQELTGLKLTVLSCKTEKETMFIEYTGTMDNQKLHWYCKSILKSGLAYAATAKATEDQWKDASVKLKACASSFELAGHLASPAENSAVPAAK
jgi:hypothetical protein